MLSALTASLLMTAQAATPRTLTGAKASGTYTPAAITQAGQALYSRNAPPAPRYSVARYDLTLRSTDEKGKPLTVRAQIFVPQVPKGTKLPVYVLGPGTTGLADACSVFNERPEVASWGWYQGHMLSYAAQGFIGVMTDYAYFNDKDRLQPYFVSASEARIMLDAARAAYQFFEGAGKSLSARPQDAVFFSGYSQGGHSSFAAADLARRYAPDVPVTGVAVFGATTNVETLWRENAAFAPYAVAAYEAYYGKNQADARQILLPKVYNGLNTNARSRCIADLYSMYSKRPEDVFQPEFVRALRDGTLAQKYPTWAKVLRTNNAGMNKAGASIPAFVAQGSTDDIVTEAAQRAFVGEQCKLGRAVTYKTYRGINHYQTRQVALNDALEWMKNVADRKPVSLYCGS
ncbi:Secretory lipase [Deinococcus peraridilitoris DSM 19664]|uniref:Secretory lipase n=2 Tax=Deinococcus TaxID=1298 RepID=L0A1S9_DEIPD|nr:Secretory lipase [Deinococcus peraridilitoris DSM 19664]